jgi:hypothetical protein
MLAQIAHVMLGAHGSTMMGLESNAMQFYMEASALPHRVQRFSDVMDLIAGM